MDHVESYIIDGGYKVFYSPRTVEAIVVIDHPVDNVRIEHAANHFGIGKLHPGGLALVSFTLNGYLYWQEASSWHTRAEKYPFWDPHPPDAPPVYVCRDKIPCEATEALTIYRTIRTRALAAIAQVISSSSVVPEESSADYA